MSDNIFLVGIGASAGGLEALQKLVASLKPQYSLSFVVAQHLSPMHTSMLRELLARETPLVVEEVVDGRYPEGGTIYIIPPNADAELRDGHLCLLPPQYAIGPKPSVDRLFQSLAAQLGNQAVGIILSGTGSDGAKGLAAIKHAGGLTIVQDPASAKYSGMPTAALQEVQTDYVMVPEEIGTVLDAYAKGELDASRSRPKGEGTVECELLDIIALVHGHTGLDLSGYKTTTLIRRLQRRMNMVQVPTVQAYKGYLAKESNEASVFARDVLISVTEFFRDSAAFKALGEAITGMVDSFDLDQKIRIWNPGCATGEETYSLAILFEEAIRTLGKPIRYKIFATDMDTQAIAVGRLGVYDQAICEALPAEWRTRYFKAEGERLHAAKRLRNNIVFSVQNLVQDPPFSRIDLISCRNLLIYFNKTVQKRLIGLFNYALNPHGILFLGKSESIETHKDLFLPVNKRARIFRKQEVGVRSKAIAANFQVQLPPNTKISSREKPVVQSLALKIQQFAVEHYAPSIMALNHLDEVFYIVGDVSPFIDLRSGPAALNVFSLVTSSLRTELRALIYKCRRQRQAAFGTKHVLKSKNGTVPVRLAVRPMTTDDETEESDVLLVLFETSEKLAAGRKRLVRGSTATADQAPRLAELEQELIATREHLHIVIEELETSNQELQSLTEELQSANEELQSTNEELQTSNEELHSTNEELLTVNDELGVKSHELEMALTDLENILRSTSYPLLVVDQQLRVTRHVPAVEQLIEQGSMHTGDMITAVSWKLEIADLRGILRKVMETDEPYQEIVQCDERYYRFQANPYHLGDREIVGAVLWFPEVTDVIRAHLRMAESEGHLRAVMDSVLVGVITTDSEGVIRVFNPAAEQMFGYSASAMIGERVEKIIPTAHAERHRSYIERYLKTGEGRGMIGQVRELEAVKNDGSPFPIDISVNALEIAGERHFTAVITDISKRKQTEKRLYEEQLRALVTLESINDAVIAVDREQRIQYLNPVAEKLTGWSNQKAANVNLCEVYQIFEEKDRAPLCPKLLEQMQKRERITLHEGVALKKADGTEFSIEQSIAPLVDQQGQTLGAVLSFRDVTNKRVLLQRMTWQAQHDPLTSLVNRTEFERRVESALLSAKSFDRQHALLFLDLDQFKLVNDTCGHHAGDELLRQLASLLGASLRSRDTLARMGGDEFAVLAENCTLSQAEGVAEKLRELIQEFRFSHEDKVFRVGVSIGVVPITRATKDRATVLGDADAACYAAKEAGRNRVRVHLADDKELEYKRSEMHWAARINRALDDNRFQLYLQPIKALRTAEKSRWEVLLRLVDERGSLVLPGVFLPAAERYGLIQSLDRWVLTRVIQELTHCPAAQRPVLYVNLSGSSLVDTKFFDCAVNLVKENIGVAEHICFEITETTAITNFAAAQEFMRAMKRLGCLFALDDFGSGMSSFGYLKNLPVDYLKIDGVFVKDILHDQIDLVMVESINRIGQIMNIKTIAEFAETDSIIDKLVHVGVDYAQGYAVSRPVPLKKFRQDIGIANWSSDSSETQLPAIEANTGSLPALGRKRLRNHSRKPG